MSAPQSWKQWCLGGDTELDARTSLMYGNEQRKEVCTPTRALGCGVIGCVMVALLVFPMFLFGFGLQGGRQHRDQAFFKAFSTAKPGFPTTEAPVPQSPYWGSGFSFPYPTNRFWQGAMLPGDYVYVDNQTQVVLPNYAQSVLNVWPYFVHLSNTSGPSFAFIGLNVR